MGLDVTYKGSQIAQLSEDGNLTLETAGKYCEGNIELAYTGGNAIAYIGTTWPAGSTCTCSNGTTTLEADDTGGAFIFDIPSAGTWTVICTDGSQTASQSITVAANHVYTVPLSYFRLEPFSSTSDENFVNLIQAAHDGVIDLHNDAGWHVGDKRSISISAFRGGGPVSHAAQTIDIAISSFDDYENCGCVMQFDFVDTLAAGNRINSSDTNSGGYGSSEMKTTTLPALVNALPAYLRDLLIEFSCKASAGSQSSTINTVTGNKLALRSEIEIFGARYYSKSGEGSQIPYYQTSANRVKKRGHSGSAKYWWLRSPNGNGTMSYVFVTDTGSSSSGNATTDYGLAPFGCI